MQKKIFYLLTIATLVMLAIPINVMAISYDVNRLLSAGNATLNGTISIDEGVYTITNQGANPFTSVDLTLTVNSTDYFVNNVLTDLIIGTGQFQITATSTELTFLAIGDSSNPADLIFSDNLLPLNNNRYVIGSNGNPAFEVAYTDSGNASNNYFAGFPVVFGIAAVPEPSTMLLLGTGLIGLVGARRKFKQ